MTFTKEQANVLTVRGFYAYFKLLVDSGLDKMSAYDRTEAIHEQVDLDGQRKYDDYSSFRPQIYRESKKV